MSPTIATIEAERLTLQAELDAQKTAADRNKLGQFATPTELARDILDFGRKLLGVRKNIHFLDPAIGTGSFYSALQAVAPASRIGRSIGFDIDPHYADPATRLWSDTPLDLRIEDFTQAAPPGQERHKANLIICNPPYVRHHHMSAAHKQRLQYQVTQGLGIRPNGLSGLYCYFLYLADAWLQSGGVAGWLIPSEWMDVNYGAQVKEYLCDRVQLLRIHRFDPSDVQFGDALVSSAIVWFRKQQPSDRDEVEFSYGGTLGSPHTVTSVKRSVLATVRKWTQLPGRRASVPAPRGQARLADIFTIKRGVATGSNRFFVLSAAQVAEHGLPDAVLRPILPSPRHLEVDDIRSLDDGSPDIEKRRYLLSIGQSSERLAEQYPAVWEYLLHGRKLGIHERYLCRHRRPWYAQEHRPAAPILCTYMGRKTDKNGSRPFRFIFNRSQATAANVYLLLYPRSALARASADDPGLMRALWSALNNIPVDVLLGEGRVYGGGLYKLEPRELANAPLAALGVELPEGVIQRKHHNLELFPV